MNGNSSREFCKRCESNGRDYKIIYRMDDSSWCDTCGLNISTAGFDDGFCFSNSKSTNYLNCFIEPAEKSPQENQKQQYSFSHYSKKITKSKSRDNYFKEVLMSYSRNCKSLSHSLLQGIYEQFSKNPRYEDFKNKPTKKNFKEIFKSIKVPNELGKSFKSRRSKKPLSRLDRKNIKMRWIGIMTHVCTKMEKNFNFYYLNDDLIDVLRIVRRWMMHEYGLKRHEKTCVNWIDCSGGSRPCKCRKATVNVSTMIFTILFMLNPLLVDEYKNTINIPKLKTLKDNLNRMKELLKKTYGENLEIPLGSIKNNLEDSHGKNLVIRQKILDVEKKDILCHLTFVLSSRKREDWYKVLIKTMTELFYPTLWKEIHSENGMKVEEENN